MGAGGEGRQRREGREGREGGGGGGRRGPKKEPFRKVTFEDFKISKKYFFENRRDVLILLQFLFFGFEGPPRGGPF